MTCLVDRRISATLVPAFVLALGIGAAGAGTDFWLANTPSSGPAPFTIAIGNPNTATASVAIFNQIEGTTLDTVSPGTINTYTFPSHSVYAQGPIVSTNPVYHVTSNIPVAVSIYRPLINISTNDAAMIFAVDKLGDRYRIGNYVEPTGNTVAPFVGVIAVEPGTTTVEVFDSNETLVDSVSLAQGEYFQRITNVALSTVADEMTGWEVVADSPVAAFSGMGITSVLAGCCGDHLQEQLLPENQVSSSYVVCPTRTRPLNCGSNCAVDGFRFVATEDGTTVSTVPSVFSGTIDSGDFGETFTDDPFVVFANKPLYIYQYLVGNESTFGSNPAPALGDPAMVDVFPIGLFRSEHLFLSPAPGWTDSFINITARVGTNIELDSVAVTEPCDFAGSIGGTDYCCIRKAVSTGTHTLTGDDKFGLVVSGFSGYGSYAYPGPPQRLDCVLPPPDMVAWWTLDENSGPTAFDYEGSNHGTHVNGPTPQPGKVDGALAFDGLTQFVQVPDDTSLDFGTGDFSIDAWIKTGSTSGLGPIVDKRDVVAQRGYQFLVHLGNLALLLADNGAAPGYTYYISSVFVATNQWEHVAVTVDRDDASGIKFYLNGFEVESFSPLARQGSLSNDADLFIGTGLPLPAFFDNLIDELELFDRELDSTEVFGIFSADSAGKCKPACLGPTDTDSDSVADVCDNCVLVANSDQLDSDGDLVGNACDNCVSQSGSDQTDADNDTFGAVCDCDDGDPQVWATPGEARDLTWGSPSSFSWSPPALPGGSQLEYDILRSTVAADFDAADCLAPAPGISGTDTQTPPAGAAFHYLIRAENDCGAGEGSLGTDSFGLTRTGVSCP